MLKPCSQAQKAENIEENAKKAQETADRLSPNEKWESVEERMDLFDNSVSCRTSLAKYYVFCLFPAEVVSKLKFPNNSIFSCKKIAKAEKSLQGILPAYGIFYTTSGDISKYRGAWNTGNQVLLRPENG